MGSIVFKNSIIRPFSQSIIEFLSYFIPPAWLANSGFGNKETKRGFKSSYPDNG
jgi:hypothetical protein